MERPKEYPDKNTLYLNEGGTKFILYEHILGDKMRLSTTKGYETCQVPLCLENSANFVNPNESCEYGWYNTVDLTALSILVKK